MDSLVQLLLLATLAESVTEYFLAQWVEPYTKYAAAVVGVVLAINFQVDMFVQMFGMESIHPIVGCILTGVLLGRGSNFVHDLWSRFVIEGLSSRKVRIK